MIKGNQFNKRQILKVAYFSHYWKCELWKHLLWMIRVLHTGLIDIYHRLIRHLNFSDTQVTMLCYEEFISVGTKNNFSTEFYYSYLVLFGAGPTSISLSVSSISFCLVFDSLIKKNTFNQLLFFCIVTLKAFNVLLLLRNWIYDNKFKSSFTWKPTSV